MKTKRKHHALADDGDSDSLVPLMDVLFSVLAGVMFCLAIAEFGGRIEVDLPGVAAMATKWSAVHNQATAKANAAEHDQHVDRVG